MSALRDNGLTGEGCPAQRGVLAGQIALQGIGDVLDEVEAIGHLQGLRCPEPNPLGIGPRAIPRDDQHLGMPAQPGGEGLRRPIRQQVDDPLQIKVDEDRAVAASLAARPIIDTERPDRPGGGERGRAHEAQKRTGTDRRALDHQMPRPGFTPKVEGGTHKVVGESRRAPGEGSDQVGQALGEDLAAAPPHAADKPTHAEVQGDAITTTGEIGERALVVRVDPFRAALTEGTASVAPGGADGEMDRGALTPQTVNPHAGEGGKEEVGEHGGRALSPRGNNPWSRRLPLTEDHRDCRRTK